MFVLPLIIVILAGGSIAEQRVTKALGKPSTVERLAAQAGDLSTIGRR